MKHAHREQYDVFKSELVAGAQFSPVFEFPLLKAVYHKPIRAVPFEKACTTAFHQQWVHFYTCVPRPPMRKPSLWLAGHYGDPQYRAAD